VHLNVQVVLDRLHEEVSGKRVIQASFERASAVAMVGVLDSTRGQAR
jgi:hypothetical protein